MLGAPFRADNFTVNKNNSNFSARAPARAALLPPALLDQPPVVPSKFPNNISDYGIGRLMGRGAFGSVYEVTALFKTPLPEGHRFAIKIIEKRSIKDESMAKRVRNEVSLHRRLRHPNILALYHHFEDDERVYLVMELCVRGELFDLLRRRKDEEFSAPLAGAAAATKPVGGILSESEARGVLRDVVAGLRFLHARNIIHRDLKLSNILLGGQGGQAKIADFGLAVDISANSDTVSADPAHEQRTICGTPNYLAPEILDRKCYGKTADIWSLGCLLYSFLCGRPPFDSSSLTDTFDRVRRMEYAIPAHVSPAARDLITRLLQPDPSNRPSFDQIIWHPFFNPSVSLPLSTLRLQPLQQQTKYGNVAIDRDGTVQVDFLDASDVLLVSSDGLRVSLQDKAAQLPESSRRSFSLSKVPDECKRRYEYARRFINLIKSKVPLIIISTAAFKASLMENSCIPGLLHSVSGQLVSFPVGDFYLQYRREPLRLEYCWVSRQLRFIDATHNLCMATLTDPNYLQADELDARCRPALLEFLARYQQALKIRDELLHVDGRSRSPQAQFPFIAKEGTLDRSSSSSSMATGVNQRLGQPKAAPSGTLSSINFSASGLALGGVPAPKATTLQMYAQRRFLSDVGWCLQVAASDCFMVLFLDGTALFVDGSENVIVDGEGQRWPITTDLPITLKQQLALFSKFLY